MLKLIKLVLLLAFLLGHSKFGQQNLVTNSNEIDFKSAAKVFCHGKSSNFCSQESLKIMFEIEEQRQERAREMARQMKRMEREIIRNILKMMG